MTDATAVLTAIAPAAAGEFRIGRVFSRTLALLSRNLPTYFVVTGIAALPGVLLRDGVDGSDGAVAGAAFAVFAAVLGLALGLLSQAIVLHGAFQDMRGRPVSLVQSLRAVSNRLLVVVGLALGMGFAVGIGFLLFIVPGFVLLTMWFVATPACVVERLGVGASMARSSALTLGHRWKIFGMMILVGVIESIAGVAVKAALGLTGNAGLIMAGMLIWSGVWGAFHAVFAVATYHDLRVAKEGIDTEQIAAVFD
jgi:hypothetical protein